MHRDSFINFEKLGTIFPPYLPTFDFPNEYIDGTHEFFGNCPTQDGLIQIKSHRSLASVIGDCVTGGFSIHSIVAMVNQIRNYFRFGGSVIFGWLCKEETLKLYEIGYFVSGDILEFGSYNGLSTSILSKANHNSPYKKTVYSVELKRSRVKITNRTLRSMGLEKDVITICDDAFSALKKFIFEGKKFEFVFIDQSHTYDAVSNICCALKQIVKKGGFCLFHDFNDPRNKDPDDKEYGVHQAVTDYLNRDDFEFYGSYGNSALFRTI
jgi:SAM-dependent methyltransferase